MTKNREEDKSAEIQEQIEPMEWLNKVIEEGKQIQKDLSVFDDPFEELDVKIMKR